MVDETKDERQPKLHVTRRIREAMGKAVKCKCASEDFKNKCNEILQHDEEKAVISTKLIKEVYFTLRDEGHKVYLHEIVEDASFFLQPVERPPRNPELEARIQKLKIEQENKEYERMTRNVQPKGKHRLTFQEEVKSMNRQILGVFNFLVTVAAGFAFGYKGTELVFGKVFGLQMMSGLVLGTIIFFVDLYFLVRYGV